MDILLYYFLWALLYWFALVFSGNILFIPTITLIITTFAVQLILSRKKSKILGFVPSAVYFCYSAALTWMFFSPITERLSPVIDNLSHGNEGPDVSFYEFITGVSIIFFLIANVQTVILLTLHGVLKWEQRRKNAKKGDEEVENRDL